jgi:hypothetical protein
MAICCFLTSIWALNRYIHLWKKCIYVSRFIRELVSRSKVKSFSSRSNYDSARSTNKQEGREEGSGCRALGARWRRECGKLNIILASFDWLWCCAGCRYGCLTSSTTTSSASPTVAWTGESKMEFVTKGSCHYCSVLRQLPLSKFDAKMQVNCTSGFILRKWILKCRHRFHWTNKNISFGDLEKVFFKW